MPNANAPRGLIPYARSSGEPYNGAVDTYYVPVGNATNLFIGDPVFGVTNNSDGLGTPSIGIATAAGGNFLLGVFMGIANNNGQATIPLLQSQTPWLAAGQAAYVNIATDPDLLYLVQEDSVGGAMPSGAGGRNVDLIAGTGNQASGYSGWMLDSSTLLTTATLQMRVRRLLQEADNAVGVNAKWLCRINLNAITNTLGV